MLGIIIGVGAVIAMVAVGRGAQVQIAEQIRSLGSNLLMVQPGAASEGGARLETGSRHTLTESDARAIESEVKGVIVAAPSIRGVAQIVRGNRNWRTIINGTTPSYFIAREWPTESGRIFSIAENGSAAKVALIGSTVAKSLFEEADPIGQEIRIDSVPFKVVGLLKSKGPTGTGRDQDNIVFIPISTAKIRILPGVHRINRDAVNYILVKVASERLMKHVNQSISDLLRGLHRLRPDANEDFRIWDPAAAMSAQQAATQTFTILVGSIASIALLVGGISIMNIMLVSVTERTREIGIRLAVGARRSDIRNQFLIEAVILCVLGGVIGMLLGAAAATVISHLTGWSVHIGIEAPLIALGAATATGIFFGLYPAIRAARMTPMEALRYE